MNASSSAWVGCSWVPSPALTTLPRIQVASRCGAPEALCRQTTPSAPIASSVSAVSLRLSPLETLEPLAEKLITSADSRLAATSKLVRVRVESSKKRLTTVRPRSVGSFLTVRSPTRASSSAVSRTSERLVAAEVGGRQQVAVHVSPSSPAGRAGRAAGIAAFDDDAVAAVDLGEQHADRLALAGREVLADVVGPDRQLAVAAVDQDGELDRARAAEVGQRVERGADGAAGEQDVVDQDDDLVVDRAGQRRCGRPARMPRSRRSSRYIVVSSEPTGTSMPSNSASFAASRWASATPRVGMPSSTTSRAAVGVLEQLVGDPGERAADVCGVEDIAAAGGTRPLRRRRSADDHRPVAVTS